MDSIKLATPEQVERIKPTADFVPTSTVLAMGEDLAVVKQVIELDPVYFAEGSSGSRKAMFIWGIENWMRLTGVPVYYFNIAEGPENEQWRQVVKTHGAEQVSPGPELRWKKVL